MESKFDERRIEPTGEEASKHVRDTLAITALDDYKQSRSKFMPTNKGESEAARSKESHELPLPVLDIIAPEVKNLPEHIEQSDTGLGTSEHPVNNNCQTTTLKNLFNFYKMNSQAKAVNEYESQLLKDIQLKHGQGLDLHAIDDAFKGDRFQPNLLKKLISKGVVDNVFKVDTKIDQLGVKGVATTPELATLFLSEMGCKPEQLSLGSKASMDKTLHALDEGKPVLIGDNDTHTLIQNIMTDKGFPKRPPVQGHVYMVYKQAGKYYVSDPSIKRDAEVSPNLLREKLMDKRSQATIVNEPPDPERFLKH